MLFAKNRPHSKVDLWNMRIVLKAQAASYPSGVIWAEFPYQASLVPILQTARAAVNSFSGKVYDSMPLQVQENHVLLLKFFI
jgi:hypothetical protein